MNETTQAPDRTTMLTQLRRVVADTPDHLLHMRAFTEVAACGTARCAAGGAAIDPWFREHTRINEVLPAEPYGDDWLVTTCSSYADWKALAECFRLSQCDADNLFAADLNVTADPHAVSKAEVLENIDRLLAGEPAFRYAATRDDDEYDDDDEDEDEDE